MERMDFGDGKYTVIYDEGHFKALRYGQPWRNLNGDHLTYSMLVEAIRLKEERDALAEWKRQAEWIDEPFKAEALAEYGFAAPTPREFSKKILERHRPHVAKLQAERDALAAKLKEMEGQEPVATWNGYGLNEERQMCAQLADLEVGTDLFARPVPAEQGHVTVTTDDTGRCIMVSRQDDDHRILSVIWEAPEKVAEPVNAQMANACRAVLNSGPDAWHPITTDQARNTVAQTLAAAESQQAEPVRLDKSEVEDLAWEANQEALSFGVSLEPFTRLVWAVEQAVLRKQGYKVK